MATDDKGKGGKNQITLKVVVGAGTEVEVSANINAPLHTIKAEALNKSGNKGQNPDDWELKNAQGTPYNESQKVSEAGLTEGATVYLSRKAGGGG